MRSLALPFLGRLGAQQTPPAQSALDATLLKTKAGLDDFVTEKYHDQIAAILAQWRTNLAESVARVLAPSFLGTSPQPVESRIVRPGPAGIPSFTAPSGVRIFRDDSVPGGLRTDHDDPPPYDDPSKDGGG